MIEKCHSQIDNSDYQIQGQMKCLTSDKQLRLSNVIKVAFGLFIAVLKITTSRKKTRTLQL